MAEATETKQSTNGVFDELKSAIAAIPGVELVEKKTYIRVAAGKTTLAYIGSPRTPNVHYSGGEKIKVATTEEIAGVIETLTNRVAQAPTVNIASASLTVSQEAKPDPKPTKRVRRKR